MRRTTLSFLATALFISIPLLAQATETCGNGADGSGFPHRTRAGSMILQVPIGGIHSLPDAVEIGMPVGRTGCAIGGLCPSGHGNGSQQEEFNLNQLHRL